MILLILLVVTLFLWFLSLLPVAVPGYPWASGWLAWVAALLLTLHLFVPALR